MTKVDPTMLSAEQIAAGWIAHDGGPCPVPLGSKPMYLCRNGWKGKPKDGRCAGDFVWKWSGTEPESDIIAYRKEPT